MSNPRPSASSLERANACPTSFALQHIYQTTEASTKGTSNHDEKEVACRHYRTTGELPAGELGDLLRDTRVLLIEGAFAVNVRTGTVRFVGESLGRNYGKLSDDEVACTVDLVLERNGAIEVIDWKSRARVTEARKNWQIKLQAVALLAHAELICNAGLISQESVGSVRAGLVYLDNWERDMATFDALDAASICADIAYVIKRTQQAKPDDPVHTGPHCTYCPAQYNCPGRLAIVRAVLPDTLDSLTDEQAGEAWAKLEVISKHLEAARDTLKDRARRSPLPLPGGKRLALVECERNGVDARKAEALLTANGIPVPMKTSRYTQLKVIK